MSAAAEPRSLLVRFPDGFFQEQNIKWVLAIGMMLLVGSSLMLVTTHWEEYTPVWKYLILLGYTGLILLAGQWSYWRLSLPRTGNILLAVMVLLLPITFLALRWAQEQSVMQGGRHSTLLNA
jgi:hypothetical protein